MERKVDLLLAVLRAKAKAQAAGTLGNGGGSNRFDQNSSLAQLARGLQGTLRGSEDNREDRRARQAGQTERLNAC